MPYSFKRPECAHKIGRNTNDKKVFLYVGRKSKNVKYNSYTNADLQSVNADEFVLTSANYDDYLDYPSEMNEYVNDVFNLAKQVIQATGKFVWLGIPRPPEPKSQITIAEYTGYANQYLNTFVVPIRDKLKALMASNGYDYYYNYVQGFYMSDEHVPIHPTSWLIRRSRCTASSQTS